MKLVEITWVDPVEDPKWLDLDPKDPPRPVEVRSVGWVIHQDKTSLTLASSVTAEGSGGWLTLPLGVIRKTRVLGEG